MKVSTRKVPSLQGAPCLCAALESVVGNHSTLSHCAVNAPVQSQKQSAYLSHGLQQQLPSLCIL